MIDQIRHDSEQSMRPQVLLLGASTRAAAMSALRSGFAPICCDQFADEDLSRLCQVRSVKSLSHDDPALRSALDEFASVPCVPTGGMENRPELLGLLASRPGGFWGASPQATSQVRDPLALAKGFEEVKQRFLELRPQTDPPERNGQWIVKPIASAGGLRISIWEERTPTPDFPHVFQQRVRGNCYSGLFLAESQPGDVRFVGLTRQLCGCPELDATPFAWCGNIGPVFLPVETEFLVRRWGNILKWKFGLTGLFGIDFIVDEQGHPWLLEVNPRYTASVEILELACSVSLFADHVACFSPRAAEQAWEFASPSESPVGDRLGRAILYAPHPLVSRVPVPESVEWQTAPALADIPQLGSVIQPGQPVCSVYAWGDDEPHVMELLWQKAEQVQKHLTDI